MSTSPDTLSLTLERLGSFKMTPPRTVIIGLDGATFDLIDPLIEAGDLPMLKQIMTDDDLVEGCRLAREYDVASVCIKPDAVKTAAEILAGSTVAVGTTIGSAHRSWLCCSWRR